MFRLIEPKMWASHIAREKAEDAGIAQPSEAIRFYRMVGMAECEQFLSDGFSIKDQNAKVSEIEHRQSQARVRIATTRRVIRNGELPHMTRQMCQSIHEDEGVIMGLERLHRIMINADAPIEMESYISAIG